MKRNILLTFVLLSCCVCEIRGRESVGTNQSVVAAQRVYIGTYTRGDSKGIYLCRLDMQTGKLTPPVLAGETANPSFLAIHPSGDYLYAVGELGQFGGKRSGAVSAFRIGRPAGKLELLNQQPSGGAGACHLVVDASGRNVLVANYSGGSIAVLPIGDGGQLDEATAFVQHEGSSVNPRRQKGPHAHSINVAPDNRFAFVADLGLDKVLVYRFDATNGTLAPNDPAWATVKPGAGPRHFAFHLGGKSAYVINELQSTVTAFAYDARQGALTERQTLPTLPDGFDEDSTTAEVQVHPSGKFLYGSNRGHDSIAVFAIDATTGRLTPVEHESTQGQAPRNFGIDPTGAFLLAANQKSDTIVVFRINQDTGALTPTGHKVDIPSPVCVKVVRARH